MKCLSHGMTLEIKTIYITYPIRIKFVPQIKQGADTSKTVRLITHGEIMTVHDHTKSKLPIQQNVVVYNVKRGGTYRHHWALKRE